MWQTATAALLLFDAPAELFKYNARTRSDLHVQGTSSLKPRPILLVCYAEPSRACSFPKSGVPRPVTCARGAVSKETGFLGASDADSADARSHSGHTHRVPSSACCKAIGAAPRVRSRCDVVEAGGDARGVDERVEETQRRLATRQTEVVEERDHTGESLRGRSPYHDNQSRPHGWTH